MTRTNVHQMVIASIHASVHDKVKMYALGNTTRSLKDLAIDLINASGKSYKEIAEITYLNHVTIANLAEEKTRWPRADTLERIMVAFDVSVTACGYKVEKKYKPRPKSTTKR